MKKLLLPLFILIQFVFADPPDWEDDPGSYEFTMYMTVAVINIDGEFIYDSGDMLAAFGPNGSVRGIGIPLDTTFGPFAGEILWNITVRSNEWDGELISFKYYNNSNDQVLSIDGDYMFAGDGMIGDLFNPFILTLSEVDTWDCAGEGGDEDYDGICDNEDDCVGEYNGCGVCNGDYSAFVNIGDQCDCWDYHIDDGVAITIILPTDYCQLNDCSISAVLNQNYFNTTVSFVMNQNEYSNYYEEFGWYGPLDETIYENTLYFVSSLAFEPFEYCNPGLGCTGFNNGTGLESGPWVYSYQWIEEGDCQMVWEWDECGGSGFLDECGVCDGPGAIYECGCSDAVENYDCNGNCAVDLDCTGACGGNTTLDCCGVCDGDNSTCDNCCGSPFYDDCSDDCYIDDSGECCYEADVDACGVCGGDDADCNNDGVDDVCEDEYDIGFEFGFFEGQSTGDANHDGELNIVDIVIFIENILND